MRGGNSKNIFKKIMDTGPGLKGRSLFAQEFFHGRITFWLLISILVANLSNWIIIRLFMEPVDFPIILHYNVHFGVDMLGDWKRVFFLPILGLIFFTINLTLSLYFYNNKERIASYILLMATLMIQLSLIVAATSVIIINY